jgi:hypothetical protein
MARFTSDRVARGRKGSLARGEAIRFGKAMEIRTAGVLDASSPVRVG